MAAIIDLTGQKFGSLTALRFDKRENNRTYWIWKCDCGNEKSIGSNEVKNKNGTKSCGDPIHKKSLLKDLTGQKFGELTVLHRVKVENSTHTFWHCKCSCGNELDIQYSNLFIRQNMHCLQCIPPIDLTGETFGSLTVITFHRVDDSKESTWLWECRCSCGNTTFAASSRLKKGRVKSCGCGMNTKGKFIDRAGEKFGSLTIISRVLDAERPTWNCKCDCGNELTMYGSNLIGRDADYCEKCKPFGPLDANWKGGQAIGSSYWASIKSNAKRRKLELTVTLKDIDNLYMDQKGICALTGLKLSPPNQSTRPDNAASLDRVDNSKGYIKGNLQWVHKDVNLMKWKHPQEYFEFLCEQVAETVRKRRGGLS